VLSPRQDHVLAAVEVAALIALAVLPVPMAPALLLVAAVVSLWIRDASFAGPPGAGPEPVLVGVAAGAVSLLAAILIAGPALEAVAGRAVEWAREPAARGGMQAVIAVTVLAAAGAIAAELAFRGWVAPRVIGLWPRIGRGGAVMIAALVEAVVVAGSLGERAGIFAMGCGLGALWAGSGQRVAPGLACRLVFEVGAVVLVALRVVS
jgi:membrane protease YdiL (CAAX protease family)